MGRWLSRFQDSPETAGEGTARTARSKTTPEGQPARMVPAGNFEHRRTVQEITRLMESDGWALVWSDTLGEEIAFARDEESASKVPGGIVVYTREELEQIIGKGHDPDMLKLLHEAKRLGAKVRTP